MTLLRFTLVKGHQVASGKAGDPRFIEGTITAQLPFFRALGLQLTRYHRATLNAEFDCKSITLKQCDYHFKQVKWHPKMPAEDFKFCRCHILVNEKSYSGLIYQPQAITKTEHFQPQNQLEILAPFIQGVRYGDTLMLDISSSAIMMISE